MSHACQFTLGLFDNTALGWTIETPRAARAAMEPETEEEDDEVDAPVVTEAARGRNLHLETDRALARGWPSRATANVAAIVLSKDLEMSGRSPTPEEQSVLLRFIGFGASELAQNCFPLPGATEFRDGWTETGNALKAACTPLEYAALQRATQYAHYTPEPIIRALWQAAMHLGFTGGRVLEPGMGTGLVFALLPEKLRKTCQLTGIEYDPITARIARFVHPEARIRCEDYTRSKLAGEFDLAIGNPPFADRIVRADPTTKAHGLRLHDYFIARSIARLRAGGLALFVTSTGTMDKASTAARQHIASMADLIGAVRLPEGSMRATAGTDVVIDILVFQRRGAGRPVGGEAWIDLTEVPVAGSDPASLGHPSQSLHTDADAGGTEDRTKDEQAPRLVTINRYFADHPAMVLGEHQLRRGIYGPGLTYTCRPRPGAGLLEPQLTLALATLPVAIFTPSEPTAEPDDEPIQCGTAADDATVKEGSYLIGKGGQLMQIIDGTSKPVAIKAGKGDAGIAAKSAKIIRALLPIRDAVREVLRAQAADLPWTAAQIRLRIAYATFVRYHGPINHTVVSLQVDAETGEERETHRRPNLSPFADDPDCWLVASITDYDLESGLERMGPIFRERVIAPPAAPLITNAADALAVTLSQLGRVDIDHLADLLESDPEAALAQLGATVFRNPATHAWETADSYLSGAVRTKLTVAAAAAALDGQFDRNVAALRDVQPHDLRPSDITARLGAPWIPTDVIETFAADMMGTTIRVMHCEAIASWTVAGSAFVGTAAGTSEWGTSRRHAGALLHDALNSSTPQIFDTVWEDGSEKRVLNVEATEAAKDKLARIKDAFTTWVWTHPDRTDRLARIYNDRFNNLVPRHFNGQHLTLTGASSVIALRPHQKRAVWRIVATGSSYIAHAVGAGKTYTIAAAIMEQRRLGLVGKAMLVVPGHCLAQASREFLQLYPTARILVADETNFTKDKRSRFLARAATATWDAIIITHSAFRFIAVPTGFESAMIDDQLSLYETIMLRADSGDRVTRKRLEAMKEKLGERLETLKARRDDMLTIEEIGIDQVIVDEAQEFRKLSFATNRTTLKGVAPEGSQRAWDLFVKARFIDVKNPGRALVQSSGTPITNTLGEMYTVLRFQAEASLRERGVHEFDAWASAFGDTVTELELQPSGTYKPVERFSTFINVPELIAMFRSIADVVLKDDLRGFVKLPNIRGGERQLVTAAASPAFRTYQKCLARRIKDIEKRTTKVVPGDDILLAVIIDGRHAAIDMRLAWPDADNEPDNKLNKLIAKVHHIWHETAGRRYTRPDGTPYPITGAGQLIFSDLGTIAVEAKRGFSAYRWIKQELVRLGVPAAEIAFMQDFKTSTDKQRLFGDFNAGRIRVLLGSSQTMGTGVNVQARLIAEHHLDVPWLPSEIEQREGRIERQGNQNPEVQIYAYATLGSMDATMWQNNARKARFVAAALAGDPALRRLEDIGSQANQFAMAKAIASGDGRLMLKAGLESEIARLERQRAAHLDDQHDIRRRIYNTRSDKDYAERRIPAVKRDIALRTTTLGDAFAMTVEGKPHTERKRAGAALLSKMRLAVMEDKEREWAIGSIAGFDLTGMSEPARHQQASTAVLILERTNLAQRIDIPDSLTALGLIARLEHSIDLFDAELDALLQQQQDATARLAGYEARLGEPFALRGELDDKLARLKNLEADLAKTESVLAEEQRTPKPDAVAA